MRILWVCFTVDEQYQLSTYFQVLGKFGYRVVHTTWFDRRTPRVADILRHCRRERCDAAVLQTTLGELPEAEVLKALDGFKAQKVRVLLLNGDWPESATRRVAVYDAWPQRPSALAQRLSEVVPEK